MLCDMHTHSKYSFDGCETIEDMCLAAIEKGISVLAITDHAEALEGVPYNADERARILGQKEEYLAAREKFSAKLDLLFGCELGQAHLNPEYAAEILEEFEFDFILGSLHFYRGNVDLYDVTYTRENADEYLKKYFAETEELIAQGGFHSFGHLDYIMRRLQPCFDGMPTYRQYEEQVDSILKMLVARDMALEINTSGLRQWMGALSMESWILMRFRELGGKYVTIGSDAHIKKDIGTGLCDAIALLKASGFTYYNYYKKGKPISVSI